MTRKNITWFGFKITQKQSVQIFIVSIIGLFISVFLLMTMISSVMMNFMYYDPYYYPDDYFIFQVIYGMLPYILIFSATFFMSLYSLIRCRKIAKNYSPLIDPMLEPKPIPRYTEVRPHSIAQFCPSCGKMMKGHKKFCTNCGREVGY